MIILLSPAKSLNWNSSLTHTTTSPIFKKEAAELVAVLKDYTAADLSKLMHISPALGELNYKRFQEFRSRHTPKNSRPAVFAFNGDVYRGLQAATWNQEDLLYAQEHLRILSGLYGILKPLDTIQAYRLEMGTGIQTSWGKGLYRFWGDKIGKQINKDLRKHPSNVIVNLASNEYFKSVDTDILKGELLHINFREYRNGQPKFISFSAKVARGLVADYIIRNQFDNIEDIKGFNAEGYALDEALSFENNWIFSR